MTRLHVGDWKQQTWCNDVYAWKQKKLSASHLMYLNWYFIQIIRISKRNPSLPDGRHGIINNIHLYGLK